MNWYKKASSTNTSDDGRQKGWEDIMGDIQRYIYDPYQVRVYLTKVGEDKYALSLTLSHIWSGGIVWQDFWRYNIKEPTIAKKTYRDVSKAADKIFQDFRSNEIPNNLLHTYLREAVRHIDLEHKPSSRIPSVDWAREQDGHADWRTSIYGTRYPKSEGY